MAREAVIDRVSFAAGEVSPALRGRTDLARNATAVRFLENMVVLAEGGATRRPGWQYLMTLKDPTQAGLLIPFRFAVGDVLMLVFNAGVMRVIANGGVALSGGVPYELAIPYAAADLPNIRFAASGNFVFLACTGKQPQLLTRTGSDINWTIGPYLNTGGPVDVAAQNLNTAITIQASAVSGAINLTGVGTTWDAGLVGGIFKLGIAIAGDVPIWSAAEDLQAAGGVASHLQRQFQGNYYELTQLSLLGGVGTAGTIPPTHLEGAVSSPNNAGTVTWTFRHPGYTYVRVGTVTDATHMAVTLVLPAGSTTWQLPTDITATPTYRWTPPAWCPNAGWPDRVMLYQNSLLWGRHNKAWITTTNNFFDFDLYSVATTSLSFAAQSGDGSLIDIEWAAPAGVVVIGGHDGEYIARGVNTFDNLTAAATRVVPENSKGSCPHIPASAEGGTVYIGRDRRRLHHIVFQPLTGHADFKELTMMARHILKGRATRVAWAADPGQVAWVCCQDGALVSVTFNLEQNVIGWARHPLTNGFVEDIAAIPAVDDTVTEVYAIIRRTINGATTRYVERLRPYFDLLDGITDARGAWFLDCSSQYVGAPAVVIGGLTYLQGQQVWAHTDGYQQGPFTVDNAGTITLAAAAANVVVGLPIPWRLRTLSFDVQGQGGSSKGVKKEANSVVLDLLNAAGGTIAVNPDQYAQWDDIDPTGANGYGAPIPLFSGLVRMSVQSASDLDCVVELRAQDTMPFTVRGITPSLLIEEPT